MSIGGRLINLVRSNLTTILDRAGGDGSGVRIESLSDEELERELTRRRQRREAAERGASTGSTETTSTVDEAAWEEVERAMGGSGRYRTAGYGRTSRRSTSYRTQGGKDPRLARLYAQLECPYGADATTIRKHYRAMMRKYHPDMHSGEPHKERIATELSQRLTMAYNELKRVLK